MCTAYMRQTSSENKNQITAVGPCVTVSAAAAFSYLRISRSYSIWEKRKTKWIKTALGQSAKGGDRSIEMRECLNSARWMKND